MTYTPAAGFTGPDTFTYTVIDSSGLTDTATVTVQVFEVNGAPTADDDSFTVNEDSGANDLAVLSNDTDPENDTLTITAVTRPTAGSVVNNGTSVSYTLPLNFNGTATFGYTISDGNGNTDTANVTVTVAPVNDTPIAVGDFATTTTGTPVVVNVLANDFDQEGDALTVTAVTQPANGTASINLGGSSVTYVSNTGFTGVDTFTYTLSDGNGGTATGNVAINVTGGDGGLVDIDIDRLRLPGRANAGDTVTPNLRVRNNGVINLEVPATLVGVQDGQTVYGQTISVSDAPGGGASAFAFPPRIVGAGGNITWTVTIVDGDADVEQATATTRVR